MKQRVLAKELGVSEAYISMVLKGKKKPSKRLAERLSNLVKFEAKEGLKIRWPSGCAGSNPALGTIEWSHFGHDIPHFAYLAVCI